MATSHTPTPWAVLPEECEKPYIRIRGTYLGGRYKIANVITPVYDGVLPHEAVETRANAAHIVRCVNAHDALLAALREMTERFESLRELHKYGPSTLTEIARAAILKATS